MPAKKGTPSKGPAFPLHTDQRLNPPPHTHPLPQPSIAPELAPPPPRRESAVPQWQPHRLRELNRLIRQRAEPLTDEQMAENRRRFRVARAK